MTQSGHCGEPNEIPEVVKGMCKKTHTWQVADNHGNGYRAKALELLDKADGETDSRMRAEFENLPEKKSIQN